MTTKKKKKIKEKKTKFGNDFERSGLPSWQSSRLELYGCTAVFSIVFVVASVVALCRYMSDFLTVSQPIHGKA